MLARNNEILSRLPPETTQYLTDLRNRFDSAFKKRDKNPADFALTMEFGLEASKIMLELDNIQLKCIREYEANLIKERTAELNWPLPQVLYYGSYLGSEYYTRLSSKEFIDLCEPMQQAIFSFVTTSVQNEPRIVGFSYFIMHGDNDRNTMSIRFSDNYVMRFEPAIFAKAAQNAAKIAGLKCEFEQKMRELAAKVELPKDLDDKMTKLKKASRYPNSSLLFQEQAQVQADSKDVATVERHQRRKSCSF